MVSLRPAIPTNIVFIPETESPPALSDAMDIDAETCLKDWNDLAQDYKELEVRTCRVTRSTRLGPVHRRVSRPHDCVVIRGSCRPGQREGKGKKSRGFGDFASVT